MHIRDRSRGAGRQVGHACMHGSCRLDDRIRYMRGEREGERERERERHAECNVNGIFEHGLLA